MLDISLESTPMEYILSLGKNYASELTTKELAQLILCVRNEILNDDKDNFETTACLLDVACRLNDIDELTASSMGKLGGLAKSAAKGSASRENGKLGGRSRKKPVVTSCEDAKEDWPEGQVSCLIVNRKDEE